MPSAPPRKRNVWRGKICRRASRPPRDGERRVPSRPRRAANGPRRLANLMIWAMTRGALLVAAAACAASTGLAAPAPQAEGEHGMVVTAQHEASTVGLGILAAGGNAVDAAVAVGYALAVVDPCCGNIGGGGFMLIRRADGAESVINFRETAPAA